MGRAGRSGLVGLAVVTSVVWLAAGCASDRQQGASEPVRTYYTLRAGAFMPHQAPLPNATDILVTWHDSKGASREVLGFRGWDFEGDGRFEMIEVLGQNGTPTAYVYDFNGDGRVDVTKTK